MKNKYEVRGDVTAIFLQHKGKKYESLIDTEDLPKAQSHPNTWFMRYSSFIDDFYVGGRVVKDRVSNHYSLHRLLMDTPSDLVVDHINHKTLDNRRSVNLRNVTPEQNVQNRITRNNRRGVHWNKRDQKWIVTVRVNFITHNFGSYDSYADALEVSRKARAKYHPFSLDALQNLDTSEIFPKVKKKSEKLSGVSGVTWHKYSKKWRVLVKINGKITIIGSYEELDRAIQRMQEYKNGLALAN